MRSNKTRVLVGIFLFLLTTFPSTSWAKHVRPIGKQKLLITATLPLLTPIGADQKLFGSEIWGQGFGDNANSRHVGDFNGDGKKDLAMFVRSGGGWYIYLSTGDSFSPAGQWADDFGRFSQQQMVGDFNGDSFTDLMIRTGTVWEVRLNTQGQSFTGSTVWESQFGAGATNFLVGNFNGDAFDDILIFDAVAAAWSVKTSNGATFVGGAVWDIGFGNGSAQQFVGDVDADGRDDIVVYFAGTASWGVARNNGAAFIDQGIWQSQFGFQSLVRFVADVDGDGRCDVIIYNSDHAIEVSRSEGNIFRSLGTWHKNLISPQHVMAGTFLSGDYNGDARVDFAYLDTGAPNGPLRDWRVALTLPPQQPKIELARNDSEAFLLLLYNPTANPLPGIQLGSVGFESAAQISFDHLGYVNTDYRPGYPPVVYADPLIPSKLKGALTIPPFQQEVVLVTIETSVTAPAGRYRGRITWHQERQDALPLEGIPLAITVWNFGLPAQPTLATDYRIHKQDIVNTYKTGAFAGSDDLSMKALQMWANQLRRRRISMGHNSQKNYVDSTANLGDQNINQILRGQEPTRQTSTLFMGYPGNLDCQWPLFFKDEGCDPDLPADQIISYLLDHTDFHQQVSNLTTYFSGLQTEGVPLPPTDRRLMMLTDEGSVDPKRNILAARAISRLNGSYSRFGNPSDHQRAGDFNGDGRTDLLVSNGDIWEVTLQGANGVFEGHTTWDSGFGGSAVDKLVGKFTADNRDDIATVSAAGAWQVKRSNGATFVDLGVWESHFAVGSDRRFVGDVNGDNLDDLIALDASAGDWIVATSSGTQFINRGVWRTNHGASAADWFVGDFNGDGKADAGVLLPSGIINIAFSNGNAFSSPIKVFEALPLTSGSRVTAADTNNNGRDNILVQSPNDGEWWQGELNLQTSKVPQLCQATHEPFGIDTDLVLRGEFGDLTPGNSEGEDVMVFVEHLFDVNVGSFTAALSNGNQTLVVPRDRKAFANVRTIAPYSNVRSYFDGVDIWVPSIANFTPSEIAALRTEQANGDQVWVWTDPGASVADGQLRPAFIAGHHPLETYLYPWYNWRHQVNGNLYWALARWEKHPVCSQAPQCPVPVEQLPNFVGNNYSDWQCFRPKNEVCSDSDAVVDFNGSLTYPGYDPSTQQPAFVSSLRLEYLRHGIEDYDYFALLQYAATALNNLAAHLLLDQIEFSGALIGLENQQENWWDVSGMDKKRLATFATFRRQAGELLSSLNLPATLIQQLPDNRPAKRQLQCVNNL